VVGIATGYRMIPHSNTDRGRYFFSKTVHTGTGAPSVSHTISTKFLSRWKSGRGVIKTSHLYLLPIRMSVAAHLLPYITS
jgi:hypothetical protein